MYRNITLRQKRVFSQSSVQPNQTAFLMGLLCMVLLKSRRLILSIDIKTCHFIACICSLKSVLVYFVVEMVAAGNVKQPVMAWESADTVEQMAVIHIRPEFPWHSSLMLMFFKSNANSFLNL